MKRYTKQVKKLDKKEIDIKQFVKEVISPNATIDSYTLIAVYRIYKEDGGKLSQKEFFKKAGIKLTKEEKKLFNDFMKNMSNEYELTEKFDSIIEDFMSKNNVEKKEIVKIMIGWIDYNFNGEGKLSEDLLAVFNSWIGEFSVSFNRLPREIKDKLAETYHEETGKFGYTKIGELKPEYKVWLMKRGYKMD